MTYLVDTNIISEVRKGARCDRHVAQWYGAVGEEELHLSVLALGEIRKGIELARPKDPAQAQALDRWLSLVRQEFGGRIFPVDGEVAEEWGRMNAPDPVSTIDGLMAATAKVKGLILVTRNVEHVKHTGVRFLDPFVPPG